MEHIQKDDIIIRKGILHILDSHTGYLGLSSQLLEMGPDLMEFVRGHIFKIMDRDTGSFLFWIKIHRLQRLLKISKKQMIRALSIRQEIWLNSCLISCVIV